MNDNTKELPPDNRDKPEGITGASSDRGGLPGLLPLLYHA